MKKNLSVFLILLTTSCATRGYKVGDQLPEYHPYYQKSNEVIFAEGGEGEKIVFENISSDNHNYISREDKFVRINELKEGTRSIASEEEIEIVFSNKKLKRLKPVKNNSRSINRKIQSLEHNLTEDENINLGRIDKNKVFYSAPRKLFKDRESTSHLRHILYYNSKNKVQ